MDRDAYDWDKIDEVALALLSLTLGATGPHTVWKGLDWNVLDRMHARGWISDPTTKARSVRLSAEGEALAHAALERHFRKP